MQDIQKAELQKDFFCPVSGFSMKNWPKFVCAKFRQNMIHKIQKMLGFFAIFFIWS